MYKLEIIPQSNPNHYEYIFDNKKRLLKTLGSMIAISDQANIPVKSIVSVPKTKVKDRERAGIGRIFRGKYEVIEEKHKSIALPLTIRLLLEQFKQDNELILTFDGDKVMFRLKEKRTRTRSRSVSPRLHGTKVSSRERTRRKLPKITARF